MTSRPTTRAQFNEWNEDMVRRYDPDAYHTRSPLPIRLLERLRVHQVVRLLDCRPSDRVLEVGCGGGNVLERVAAHRVGLDLSPWILAKARARLGGAAQLVRGDAQALPFADGAFDRVFCSEVLEHLLEPEAALAEMRRVVAPGGWVVVSVPNEALINRVKRAGFRLPLVRRLLGGGDGYQMAERMDDEWHLHSFSRERVITAMGDRFSLDQLIGVPNRFLPLRWVARLLPR
jgi:ubiquinone/menaquinone biosynthesis C-methylase UbiE